MERARALPRSPLLQQDGPARLVLKLNSGKKWCREQDLNLHDLSGH